MNTLEVLTLLLVVFAALTYIDNKHPQKKKRDILSPKRRGTVNPVKTNLFIGSGWRTRGTPISFRFSNLIINQPCGFCKRFRIGVPCAPLFCYCSEANL